MSRKKTVIAIVGICALFLGNVIFSQAIFLTNIRVASLNNYIAQLNAENKELAIKVARKTSVNTIKKKAVQLGFVEDTKIIYLNPHQELARHE